MIETVITRTRFMMRGNGTFAVLLKEEYMQRHRNIGVLIFLYFDPSQRHSLDAIFGSEYEMGGLRCVRYYCEVTGKPTCVCLCGSVETCRWVSVRLIKRSLLRACEASVSRRLFYLPVTLNVHNRRTRACVRACIVHTDRHVEMCSPTHVSPGEGRCSFSYNPLLSTALTP